MRPFVAAPGGNAQASHTAPGKQARRRGCRPPRKTRARVFGRLGRCSRVGQCTKERVMARAGKAKRTEPPKHKPTDPAERIFAAAMEVAERIGWRLAALAD